MRLALTPPRSSVFFSLAPRLAPRVADWRRWFGEAAAPAPAPVKSAALASRVQAALQAAARARR